MHLLVALQYYLPNYTGYTLHVLRAAEALAARGHRITVLAARHPSTLPARETVNGVDVIRLAAPLRVSRGAVMPHYAWHAYRLAAQADAIWINTPLLETALWAAIAKLRGKRLVITHHGDLHLPPGATNRAIEAFTFANYKVAAAVAATIVAYSDDYANFSPYLRPWRDKVRVIPAPIVIPPPQPEGVAALRARLNPAGGPIVGYAGRFVLEKRPDLLLRAAIELRPRFPDLRVAFAGVNKISYEDTWARTAALVDEAGDAAVFLGLIEDAQALANFYASCDVLVLPSDTECFGTVQVEAMLCGTPAIVSDIPGLRAVVMATGMGRLFAHGDASALAAALADVLTDRTRYLRPREAIEREFDLASTTASYEAAFFDPA
jgi:glycosyltransferase involved in cell wall biosynthesis